MTAALETTDLIQSIGIVVTLLLAIWQMRVQSKHVEAATDLALTNKLDEVNKIWFEHPGLYGLLEREFELNNPDPELDRLETVVFIVFNTLELAYRHYKVYGMDDDAWSDWAEIVDIYLRKPYLRGWWPDRASQEYGNRFRNYIDSRIRTLEAR